MTFMEDLIRDATASAVPVDELLRRLKVIAARSKTAGLAAWVGHELDGYPASVPVPEYRGPFEAPVSGQIANPARVVSNVPIAPVAFPKEYRDGPLFNVTFRDSVAELHHMATSGDGDLHAVWPGDAIALTEMLRQQGKILDGFTQLVSARLTIPRSLVVGVLDAVRNRILDLALSFEEIAPDAGESPATPEESARMSQVFNTNIYGNGQTVIGSTNVHQVQVNRGDEGALLAALSAAGVDPDSLEELKKALAEDRAENGGGHPAEPGLRVSRWWTRWRLKAAGAVGAIATDATGDLIAQALRGFFGMS